MGILDGIVEWFAEQVMNILDMINTSVLGALGCDMETFLRYFPAAETFYGIIVALAVGLLLLNLIFQLFRNFGIMQSGEAESPVRLTARTMLFLFLALFSDEILNIVLQIGGTPFGWMMTEELPPINFADFNSVLLTILGVSLNGSIALIALILLIILAWNYLKLLFEAAERYVLLGVLVYTAPMAFSMGGSMNTINIFRSWCRMLGGQIFMILMNVWCLRIFTSMFANFIANPLQLENGNFLIWFLCAVGFLKISQKIDNFMQMLGINVGRTGSAMLGEAAIAMKGISAAGKTISGGGSGAADSGSYMASGSETILQGGLAGAVGRQFNQNAIRNITGKSDSIASNIARSVYNSSIRNGGGFSANIIGQVAKGDIARTGFIKGEDAVQAFQSYMGIDRANHTKEKVGAERNPASAENTTIGNQSTYSDSSYAEMQTSMEQVLAEYQQNIGMEPLSVGTELSDDSHSPFLSDHQTIPLENRGVEQAEYFTPSVDSSAQYSHIEIGGGRIMGVETSKDLGGSLKFAMYSTDKYMPPTQGDYKMVTAVDGSKWYHQYAQPTVVKEPFMKENGEIQYKEHISIVPYRSILQMLRNSISYRNFAAEQHIIPHYYLQQYLRNPFLENLVKMRMYQLAYELVHTGDYFHSINKTGSNMKEILQVAKQDISLVQKLDMSMKQLRVYRRILATGMRMDEASFLRFYDTYWNTDAIYSVL